MTEVYRFDLGQKSRDEGAGDCMVISSVPGGYVFEVSGAHQNAGAFGAFEPEGSPFTTIEECLWVALVGIGAEREAEARGGAIAVYYAGDDLRCSEYAWPDV